MKQLKFYFLVIIVAACTACNNNDDVENVETPLKSDIVITVDAVKYQELIESRNLGDDFEIKSVEISGNNLLVDVEYRGGIAKHKFEVVSNIGLSSSLQIGILHDNNSDKGNAIIQEKISVSLLSLGMETNKSIDGAVVSNGIREQDVFTGSVNSLEISSQVDIIEGPEHVNNLFNGMVPFNQVNISKVVIDNGYLFLSVEYSGGCVEHFFKLYWDSDVAADTLKLYLVHNPVEDNCDALIHEDLKIKLTDISADITADKDFIIYNMFNGNIIKLSSTAGGVYSGNEVDIVFGQDEVDKLLNGTYQSMDLKLNGANVDEIYLQISASYAGGCEEHSFKVFWNKKIADNTVKLYVFHNKNTDGCEAWLTDRLLVKLSDLNEAINADTHFEIINASNFDDIITLK